jgi:2-oxo-3-hexenedioate decarboxylase
MEIIDSRYKDFKFELPDVIADNCSSFAFVLGDTVRDPREVDLGNLGMILEVDGKPVQFGSSAAILDHPLDSLLELCRMLAGRGLTLPAESVVLAGAATAAVPLNAGARVRASVQDLGSVEIFPVTASA